MEFFQEGKLTVLGARLMYAAVIALAAAGYGYSKRSLSLSGAIAAFVVGVLTFASAARFGLVLLMFFFSSSRLTKVNQKKKALIDGEFKENGQRDWVQVVCNGLTGTVLAVWYFLSVGEVRPFQHTEVWSNALQAAFIGHYGCCCGDTWASELGVLAPGFPRLVTTWKKVPPGTNGAVSLLGLGASIIGGTVVGVTYWLAETEAERMAKQTVVEDQWPIILLGTASGLIGSLLDSLLGATLQFSGFHEQTKKIVNHPGPSIKKICGMDVLSNHQVNFVSSLLTAVIMGAFGSGIF